MGGKTTIVCSVGDPAGSNIRERLLERFKFKECEPDYDRNTVYSLESDTILVSSTKRIVFIDDLDEFFKSDRTVFISGHYAESGIPSLTGHFTGNFGRADFGGNSGEIARFSPSLLKTYMRKLRELTRDLASVYTVTLEATHHGPTSLKSPVLFVELGSAEVQWRDPTAAGRIAEALMFSLQSSSKFEKCAVCIGGTHYSEKFNNSLFDSEFALGPIIPKYALEFLDSKIVAQILEKSDQPVKYALIDKKGLGSHKEAVHRVLENFDLEKIYV